MNPTTLALLLDRGSDEAIQIRLREDGVLLNLTEVVVELVVENKPLLTLQARPDDDDPTTGYLEFTQEYAAGVAGIAQNYALTIRWPDGVTKSRYGTIRAEGFAR